MLREASQNQESNNAIGEIIAKHVYCDEKSVERVRGGCKRKYKIAGFWSEYFQEIGRRRFFVGTSQEDRISTRELIVVKHDDYLRVEPGYSLSNPNKTGKYSLRRSELLSDEDIIRKRTDPDNGFKDVATLKDEAFERFSQKTSNLSLRSGETLIEFKSLVESVINPKEIAKRLEEMHL